MATTKKSSKIAAKPAAKPVTKPVIRKPAVVSKPALPKPAVSKPATRKAAPKKAAVATPTPSPAASTQPQAASFMKVNPEQRFRMIEECAYLIAEKDGFKAAPDVYWFAAEREIADRLGTNEAKGGGSGI
jgi:hypothetical protein